MGIGVGVPAAVCRWLPQPPMADNTPTESDLDPGEKRREFAQGGFDWFFIGNSMLNSRLKPRWLATASGWKVQKLGMGGTQSAVWWLFFKNILIASGARPKWVTFFFRESDMSWPDFRLRGNNARLISKMLTPHEPEWNEVMGWREKADGPLDDGIEQLFPVGDFNAWARREMQERSFQLTDIGGLRPGARRVELNALFALHNLRRDLGDDSEDDSSGVGGADDSENVDVAGLPDPGMYDAAPTNFDPSPSVSFLPHMVALSRQHGIRLHFHRVKRRPMEDNTRPDLPTFRRYLKDMQAYLSANGCLYTDESHDREITLDWYRDGDHVQEEYQERYAKKFWSLVKDQIGPPPGAAAPDAN